MPEVEKLLPHAEYVTRYTGYHTDDRHRGSSLERMGPTFMVFDEDGSTGRITLTFEEVVHVVEGELTLVVYPADAEPETIVGVPGDLLTIQKGSSLDYRGVRGTRFLAVTSPRP